MTALMVAMWIVVALAFAAVIAWEAGKAIDAAAQDVLPETRCRGPQSVVTGRQTCLCDGCRRWRARR